MTLTASSLRTRPGSTSSTPLATPSQPRRLVRQLHPAGRADQSDRAPELAAIPGRSAVPADHAPVRADQHCRHPQRPWVAAADRAALPAVGSDVRRNALRYVGPVLPVAVGLAARAWPSRCGLPSKRRIDGVASVRPRCHSPRLRLSADHRRSDRAREHPPPAIRWGLCSDARNPGTRAQPPEDQPRCVLWYPPSPPPEPPAPPFIAPFPRQTAPRMPRSAAAASHLPSPPN